jgi:hypothetical protein
MGSTVCYRDSFTFLTLLLLLLLLLQHVNYGYDAVDVTVYVRRQGPELLRSSDTTTRAGLKGPQHVCLSAQHVRPNQQVLVQQSECRAQSAERDVSILVTSSATYQSVTIRTLFSYNRKQR